MNKIYIKGFIANDLKLTTTQNKKSILKFSIGYKGYNSEYETMFYNCIAFDKKAEFIYNFFEKGNKVLITGKLISKIIKNENGSKNYNSIFIDEIDKIGNFMKKPELEINSEKVLAEFNNSDSIITSEIIDEIE